MKISAKMEYACVAVLELASHHASGEPVRIRDIAERHGAPPRFLVQILLQLKGAGLVSSIRGATGGYRLVDPPDSISLGRVMDVIDGCPDEDGPKSSVSPDSPVVQALVRAWKDVAAVKRKMLDEITLADLLERAKRGDERMYHI